MTMLTSIMVMLSVTLVLIMVPRIYGSWLLLKESAEEGDLDRLNDLQNQHNEWIIRHLCMALLALGFVVVIKYLPELEAYSQTASATAVYSFISLTFAIVESLLAQKISGFSTATLQPAKQRQKINRHF